MSGLVAGPAASAVVPTAHTRNGEQYHFPSITESPFTTPLHERIRSEIMPCAHLFLAACKSMIKFKIVQRNLSTFSEENYFREIDTTAYWLFNEDQEMPHRHESKVLSSPALVDRSVQFSMCHTACSVFAEKLRSQFEVDADVVNFEWLLCDVMYRRSFFEWKPKAQKNPNPLSHEIFRITCRDGTSLILDLTGGQLGADQMVYLESDYSSQFLKPAGSVDPRNIDRDLYNSDQGNYKANNEEWEKFRKMREWVQDKTGPTMNAVAQDMILNGAVAPWLMDI